MQRPGVWLVALLLMGSASTSASSSDPPRRVVSVNLCADVFLLHLARREQLASLTFLAASSPLSPVIEQAQGLPANHGQVEEVLSLQPDLVVAHRYGNAGLIRRLQQLEIPLLVLEPPSTLDAVYDEIRRLARALGREEAGTALLRLYQNTFAGLAPADRRPRPLLAIYGANGITSGPGSLLHDVLLRTGFANLAEQLNMGPVGTLDMETLITRAPDALLLSETGARINSLARQKQQHPALRRLADSRPTLQLSGKLWTCGGPEILQAADALAGLRAQLP